MSTLSVACQALNAAIIESADRETLIALSAAVSRQAAAADHELSKLRARDSEKSALRASLARYVAELAKEAEPRGADIVPLRPHSPASPDASTSHVSTTPPVGQDVVARVGCVGGSADGRDGT